MSGFEFQVAIANPFTGKAYGSGHVESVTRWRYTSRIDAAGTIEFECAANDPQAEHIQQRRRAHAQALIGGFWREVGIGNIDAVETVPGADGRAMLRVSGMDLVGELGWWNVRELEIGAGSGTTHAGAISDLNFQPGPWNAAWAFHPASVVPNDYMHAKFNGQSILSALIYVAEKTGTHFYRDLFRNLHFTSTFSDSGIRAVRARRDLPDKAAAITSLTRRVDTHDLLTRIYPYGSGQDRETSLTLSATDRTPPAGYSLNKEQNYIQADDAVALYGLVDFPYVDFKEIAPISNTNADYVAACNMLYDSALQELQRRSTLASQNTYALTVAQCSALLRPMQALRLTYRDLEQNIDINETLNILAATWEMDSSGIRTSNLTVSTGDRWSKGSGDNAAERAIQGKVYQAYPQIALNEWWENFRVEVGDHQTELAGEFPFVMGPSVVTVRQVVFRFSVERAIGVTKNYAYASPNTGDTAAGIDANSAGTTDNDGASTTGTRSLTVASVGSTTLNNATVDINSTTPDSETAASTGGTEDPTNTPDQWTDPTTHRHAVSAHTHDFTHDHGTADHTHTSAGEHTHEVDPNPHAHTTPDHDHNISNPHAHTSPAHNHTAPTLVGTLGDLERVPALSTYAMADLEYSVNGGAWTSLDVATGTGDGYFQLDITNDVTDPSIPFRPAQTSGNNIVEIRCKTAQVGNGKSAMILAKLGIRTTIRGVALG